MKEKFGPCIEKHCSWCCDPVKVPKDFPNDKIPANEKGEKIWIDRNEIIAPEETWEKEKIKTFDCINYNKETGLCDNYEKRPDICRATSCIDESSKE